jgi:iron(III) transport system permease protein
VKTTPAPALSSPRDLSPRLTRLTLLLIMLLGGAMIISGVGGIRAHEASGYDSEEAYVYIRQLGSALNVCYDQDIMPAVSSLDATQQAALLDAARALLIDHWSADDPSAAETLSAIEARVGDPSRARFELLCASYALSGPKVTSAVKKQLAAVSDRAAFRRALLECLLDESRSVPEAAAGALKNLTGADRSAMLMQLFFASASKDGEMLPAALVNGLKKSVRHARLRINACASAVTGEISLIARFVLPNARTIVMIGALLLIDALLLIFLLRREGNWRVDAKWIIILLIVDFMLVFQLLPIGYLLVKSVLPDGSFSLETFRRLYSYSMNWSALKNTLVSATSTMVLGTLIAFPLAWLVGRTNLYGKKFFRSLFVLTYMVPPYLGAMAWLRLLNPNAGDINVLLRGLFHIESGEGPLNIYSVGGLIWVLTTFYYPYAFITISRAMEKMDPSLEEASRISGASPIMTVFRITLPMMTPSLIAGALLVFVSAASCYGIPSIIGAPGKIHTVTTRIIEYYGLGTQGINDATGLAVFLMVIAIIILFVSDFVVAKRQYITVSGKSTRPNIVDLGRFRVPLTCLVGLFAAVMILLPFATILFTSLKVDVGKSLLDPGNFTTGQWTLIFSRDETIDCLKNSLVFGVITATIGIAISVAMSFLLQRTRVAGRKIPDFLITLGSGTPSVVIALGLIMTMKGNFGVNIYNTAAIMVVAYLIKYLMMGMRTVVSAMSQIHVSLEECSQVSGASWLRTMFKITGPLIFPSIAAGWFLIFIPSFYELSMTTLLYSNSTKTIGFQLYEYWTFTSQPQACAMAFGILGIVVLLNFVLNRLTKGEFSI